MCSQIWGVLGGVREGKIRLSGCNANVNSLEVAKFENSIFLPLQMLPPAQCSPCHMPPFAPFLPTLILLNGVTKLPDKLYKFSNKMFNVPVMSLQYEFWMTTLLLMKRCESFCHSVVRPAALLSFQPYRLFLVNTLLKSSPNSIAQPTEYFCVTPKLQLFKLYLQDGLKSENTAFCLLQTM